MLGHGAEGCILGSFGDDGDLPDILGGDEALGEEVEEPGGEGDGAGGGEHGETAVPHDGAQGAFVNAEHALDQSLEKPEQSTGFFLRPGGGEKPAAQHGRKSEGE